MSKPSISECYVSKHVKHTFLLEVVHNQILLPDDISACDDLLLISEKKEAVVRVLEHFFTLKSNKESRFVRAQADL